MYLCSEDKSGRVLTVSYSQHVGVEDVRGCLETMRDLMDQLKPGFLLLVDLSNLDSMDNSCAQELGTIMDLCCAREVSSVVCVIPDPSKEMVFNVLSHFCHHPQIKTRTYVSLAEAIHDLLAENIPPDEAAENFLYGDLVANKEDYPGESPFTAVAQKVAKIHDDGQIDHRVPFWYQTSV